MHGHLWTKKETPGQIKQRFWEAGLCFCLGVPGTLLSLLSTQHTITPVALSPTDSQTHEVPQDP